MGGVPFEEVFALLLVGVVGPPGAGLDVRLVKEEDKLDRGDGIEVTVPSSLSVSNFSSIFLFQALKHSSPHKGFNRPEWSSDFKAVPLITLSQLAQVPYWEKLVTWAKRIKLANLPWIKHNMIYHQCNATKMINFLI